MLVQDLHIYILRKAKQDVHIKFKRGTCFSSQAKLEAAPGRSRELGSISFPTRKGYGMKHGIYAFIRTYSCVHVVHVRMVVERIIVVLRAQKVAKHVISRVFVAGSTWNMRVF